MSFENRLPTFRLPELPKIQTPAEGVFDDPRELITAFQRDLDSEHEMGILVPGSEPLVVEKIAKQPGLVLVFRGTTAKGDRAVLAQHVSQTNVMLVALPKAGPVARRVGFEPPG